jgi:hypothetical protein
MYNFLQYCLTSTSGISNTDHLKENIFNCTKHQTICRFGDFSPGMLKQVHKKHFLGLIKEMVSRDFDVCFLVLFDSSDIATPGGTGSFLKIKPILCRIFDFSGLGTGSLPCERILALIAVAANSTDTPRLISVIVFITNKDEFL